MVRARPLPPAAGPPPFRAYQPATTNRGPVSGFAPKGTANASSHRPPSPPPPRLVPSVPTEPIVEIDDVFYEDEDEGDAPPETITPELLWALRQIAPKRRRGKSLYVVLALVVAGALVGRTGTGRELAGSGIDLVSSQVRALVSNPGAGKAEPGRP